MTEMRQRIGGNFKGKNQHWHVLGWLASGETKTERHEWNNLMTGFSSLLYWQSSQQRKKLRRFCFSPRRFGESITKTIKSFEAFHLTQRVNLSASCKDNEHLLHFPLMSFEWENILVWASKRILSNWSAFRGRGNSHWWWWRWQFSRIVLNHRIGLSDRGLWAVADWDVSNFCHDYKSRFTTSSSSEQLEIEK